MTADRGAIILVDASDFQQNVGDFVEKGGTVGSLRGQAVQSPFDAVIQAVSFDAGDHVLRIVLMESRSVTSTDA